MLFCWQLLILLLKTFSLFHFLSGTARTFHSHRKRRNFPCVLPTIAPNVSSQNLLVHENVSLQLRNLYYFLKILAPVRLFFNVLVFQEGIRDCRILLCYQPVANRFVFTRHFCYCLQKRTMRKDKINAVTHVAKTKLYRKFNISSLTDPFLDI